MEEGARVRVAIADDLPIMRNLVRQALSVQPNLEIVAEAGDGAEAIDVAERERPDVMVLDYQMPVCDGLDALAGILEVSPSTRVVMFSSGPPQIREKAL